MEREGRTGRRRITGRGAPVAVGAPGGHRRPARSELVQSTSQAPQPGHRAAAGVLCTGVDRARHTHRTHAEHRRPLRRGRFGSAARSAYGDGPRGRTSPTRESRAGPCSARGALPRGRTRRRAVVRGSARSYAEARGRTRKRAVVRGSARSYLRAPPRYDLAREGTTARIRVRPRGIRYDRAGLPWARVELSRSFVYFHGETPARVSRGRGPGRLDERSSPCRLACLPRARARVPVRTPLRRRRDRRLDHVHPRPPLQAPAGRGSGHAGSEFSGARLQPPAGRGSGRPSHRPGPPTAPRAHRDAEGARRP